jgi:hypothetical protein
MFFQGLFGISDDFPNYDPGLTVEQIRYVNSVQASSGADAAESETRRLQALNRAIDPNTGLSTVTGAAVVSGVVPASARRNQRATDWGSLVDSQVGQVGSGAVGRQGGSAGGSSGKKIGGDFWSKNQMPLILIGGGVAVIALFLMLRK